MINPNNFNNLLWFIGIVEDVNDPINSGRVRVRCFDIHPPVGDDVPTDALPWSIPINGTYGSLHKIPEVAEWVFGFFLDGRDAQHPFLLGTIPGTNTAVPPSAAPAMAAGSSALNNPLPRPTSANGAVAATSTTVIPPAFTTLAQAANTAIGALASNIPTASGGGIIDAFGIAFNNVNDMLKDSMEAVERFGQNAIPPQLSGLDFELLPIALQQTVQRLNIDLGGERGGFPEPDPVVGGQVSRNSVWSGGYGRSYIEVNGTDQSEHISVVHTSGSHIQIDPHGNVKIRSLADTYNMSEGHMREVSGANREVLIEGVYNIAVKNHCNIIVDGDFNVECNDFNVTARGKAGFNVAEGVDIRGSRVAVHAKDDNVDIYASQKIKVFSGAEMSLITNGYKLQTTEYDLVSVGGIKMLASGDIDAKGSDVRIEAGSFGNFLAGSKLNFQSGKISLHASTVAMDDYVFMSSGESDTATGAEEAATPDDVAYVPYFESEPAARIQVSDVSSTIPTPGGSGPAGLDDGFSPNDTPNSGITPACDPNGVSNAPVDPNYTAPGYPADLSQTQIEEIIRREAVLRGMDPEVAVAIYRSEGAGSYQSNIARSGTGSAGGLEASYGPYQLFTGGGLGNEYELQTGHKLASDNTVYGITKQIQFSLDKAAINGWGAWYGRKIAGVGVRDGLSGAFPVNNWR